MGQKAKENVVDRPAAAVGARIRMARNRRRVTERLAAEYMGERNAMEREMTVQIAVYLKRTLAAIKPKGWE